MMNLAPWILLFPLAGFVLLGLVGRVLPRPLISLIGCGTVLAAFALAVAQFLALTGGVDHRVDTTYWEWLGSGSLHISFGLLLDQLSGVMLLIITGVGFLIHVYSIGYMADDTGYWRFFSFLNLFIFAMILLVAADNFLFLLVGWGLVGLASFLLIGYWYTRPSAVAAARKAFVVNVIGDFGLMIAIFVIFGAYGTLTFAHVLGATGPLTPLAGLDGGQTLTLIALLLLVAAAAKSAQLPLHVWLPDAMEGPTPVSALIHAATMVTAGVYLVARAAVLFTAAPVALIVVGIMGAGSALFAATIACTQWDIKRVLAYSTMSQLGYMFLGEAAGGFSTGIFHLTTHAYFKALLFMAAGAVIHALHGEQDMRKMGGLRAALPWTYRLYVVGGLALAAIVPFAGFWSKDAILGAVLARAGQADGALWYALYAVGILTALLTGYYTFRMIFLAFHGSFRGEAHALATAHEPGTSMLLPMVVLAFLALVGGLPGAPWQNLIGTWLRPVTGESPELSAGGGLFWLSIGLSLGAALLGIGLAWVRFASGRVPADAGVLGTILRRAYFVDDLYQGVIVRPVLALGSLLGAGVERGVLDGGSRGLATLTGGTSRALRSLQTGLVRNYALAIVVGAIALLAFFIVHQ